MWLNYRGNLPSLNSAEMTIADNNFVSALPPYFVQNKTCIISGEMTITKETGAVIKVLGKNLPIPYKTSGWLWGMIFSNSDRQAYRVGINDSGELCCVYQSIPVGSYVIPGISYFVK